MLDPFLDAVVQQAARSLQFFFSSSQFNEIDHILLAGGNANIPGPFAAKWVTVSRLPTRFTNGLFSSSRRSKIENDASSLMVACGLALRSFD